MPEPEFSEISSPQLWLDRHAQRREPDHWFWGLKAITGEDPVALADRGKVGRMAQAWLDWAKKRGY